MHAISTHISAFAPGGGFYGRIAYRYEPQSRDEAQASDLRLKQATESLSKVVLNGQAIGAGLIAKGRELGVEIAWAAPEMSDSLDGDLALIRSSYAGIWVMTV